MAVSAIDDGVRFIANPGLDRQRSYDAGLRAILSREKLDQAWQAITRWPGYAPTPLLDLGEFARRANVASLQIKDEGKRFELGSFKALGGAYAVEVLVAGRAADAPLPTVTCATDGNHGRAVAWGARRAGCKCVIYVHATVSDGRARAIAGYGAEVRRVDGSYDDAVRRCAADALREGWTVVSDTSWEGYDAIPKLVMQGYALLMDEAHEQGARPTHVFVQGGVGGLAAAILSWLWERLGAARPRLVVVEPAKAACLMASAEAGRWTTLDGDIGTVMAGLECGEPSALALDLLLPGADAFMAIPDSIAEWTMRELAAQGIVGGESGVAGLAGAMAAAGSPAIREEIGLDEASRVLCFSTEGATDPEVYARIVGRSADAVAREAV
jgi:diaminopropionate ammonia-lyase